MADHPHGRLAAWVLVALAGLAVAVVLSIAASSLSTQPIGLSNEPLRAGDKLAPSVTAPATAPARAPATTSVPATTSKPTHDDQSKGDDRPGSAPERDD